MLSKQEGFSIVELLMTIGLAAILFPALLTGFVATRGGRAQADQRIGAIALAQETQEEIRVIRETGWDNIPIGINFYPKAFGNSWILASLPEPPRTDGFTRITNIAKVFRDGANKIVDIGTEDPSTKKITTTVRWDNPIPYTVTNIQYLTRNANEGYVETTQLDFNNAGATKTHVVVQPTGGSPIDGEIILGPGGGADWCNPGNPKAKLDLTGSGETRAVVAGVDRAFVSSGGNNAGRDFWNVTIDNSVFPPVPTEAGTYDQNGVKANQVFGESHFAYLATDKNSNEVVILDVASNTPLLLLNLDLPNNTNGKSIFVSNNYLFVTTADNMLYRYLLANDRKSVILKGSLNLSATGNAVYVSNNYVFIAMDSSSTQLRIIDANDPNTLQAAGSLSMGNNQVGQGLFVSTTGNRAYLVTRRSSTQPEFFIINTQSKSSPAKIGSGYDTGAMDPQGITVIDNRAIIVGLGRPQYQVVKVDNDNYTQCAVVPKAGDPDIDNIYNVSSISTNGHVYSYIVTANSNFEFQIIEGGVGGSGGTYASSGTYESQTIDIGKEVVFNSFTTSTQTVPPTTDITYQIAIKPGISGSCNTVTFSSSDFISRSTGAFLFGTTGQCLRFRAILSSNPDYSQTPKLLDITFNYSK